MTNRAALLQAIVKDREADLPRMVYADWLVENGQSEWAEFVRVQLRLAWIVIRFHQFGDGTTSSAEVRTEDRDECRKLQTLEWNLWLTMCRQTLPEGARIGGILPHRPLMMHFRWDDTPTIKATLTRGFIESLALTTKDWMAHADQITALHPISRVNLSVRPGVLNFRDERNKRREFYLEGRPQMRVPISDKLISLQAYDPAVGFRYEPHYLRKQLMEANWPGIAFEYGDPHEMIQAANCFAQLGGAIPTSWIRENLGLPEPQGQSEERYLIKAGFNGVLDPD